MEDLLCWCGYGKKAGVFGVGTCCQVPIEVSQFNQCSCGPWCCAVHWPPQPSWRIQVFALSVACRKRSERIHNQVCTSLLVCEKLANTSVFFWWAQMSSLLKLAMASFCALGRCDTFCKRTYTLLLTNWA